MPRVLAVLALVLVVLPASSAGSNGSFFVGFADDLVKNQGSVAVAPADALGGKAFRITLMWQPGQAQPDPNEVGDLNRATGAASRAARAGGLRGAGLFGPARLGRA